MGVKFQNATPPTVLIHFRPCKPFLNVPCNNPHNLASWNFEISNLIFYTF